MSVKDKNELGERKKLILKAIINSYIADGEPVGSKYLMQSDEFTCSSATIRNEMSELEELGYLEQPHTSAGRVPSELGYRFYVDALIESYAMTSKEISEINNLLKSKINELDQILLTASKLAGNITNYTSFVVKPKTSSVSMKRFDVIYVDPHTILLVMISSDGEVKTRQLVLESSISQLTVTDLSHALNDNLLMLTANEITLPIIMELERAMGDKSYIISSIMKIIYDCMNELDRGDLKISGMDKLLQYPEYNNKEQLRSLLGAFEQKEEILSVLSDTKGDAVNVFIGSESSVEVMNNSAVVYKPVIKNGKTLGAIGVIGPRRMDYAKVLATIESVADNIENIINEDGLINQNNIDNGGKTEDG